MVILWYQFGPMFDIHVSIVVMYLSRIHMTQPISISPTSIVFHAAFHLVHFGITFAYDLVRVDGYILITSFPYLKIGRTGVDFSAHTTFDGHRCRYHLMCLWPCNPAWVHLAHICVTFLMALKFSSSYHPGYDFLIYTKLYDCFVTKI